MRNTINIRGCTIGEYGQETDPYLTENIKSGIGIDGIGTAEPPRNMQGGNYLLKDYSIAVTADIEALFRSGGISPGSWVFITTTDGRSFTYRWDDSFDSSLGGLIKVFTPEPNETTLEARALEAILASGPPLGYTAPQKYTYRN